MRPISHASVTQSNLRAVLLVEHSHETGTLYGGARPQRCSRRLASGLSSGDFPGGGQPDGTDGRIAEDGQVR